MKSMRERLMASSMIYGVAATLIGVASPAMAQDEPPAPVTPVEQAEVEALIVTGSRIPKTEFTSPSPIQVLSVERAEARGVADTAQFLQGSTLAAGSPQVNAAISTAFVTDGGPGAQTVSLRGLGANRTLVLLNGRRAGPAGTRGGVSSVDLNVIPQSALERVEILKDGASSIYGSDAVAGVVNLITKRNRDGGEVSAFYTAPFEGGGEQLNFSGSWGKTFERGSFSASFDYYEQKELQYGDRDYTECSAEYLTDPDTGERTDRIDPRTGQPACLDLLWGHVWNYSAGFDTRQGRYQFDYDGDLGDFIPPFPGTRNGVCPPAPASGADPRQTDPDCYPMAPAGFFLVGQDPASRAVMNGNHPFQNGKSLLPEIKRTTIFLEGTYDVTDGVEAYGEALLNRRESYINGFRQYWTYNFTEDFFDYPAARADWADIAGPGWPTSGGDPFSEGFTGPNLLSPTPLTDHSDDSQKVDYMRFVGGLRGDVPGIAGWNWDLFVQHSISDADYTSDQILDDSISTQSFRTESCVGTTTPFGERECMDINFTDPRVLAGMLTAEEEAFLFDVETGNTTYTQTFIEGSAAGDLMTLPAGPVGGAVGFHFRKDEIDDVPGPITLAGNAWNTSSAGITRGSDRTGEFFGELAIPVFRDAFLAHDVDLTLSGRWTTVETSGSAKTYKIGLSWAVTPEYKFRYTTGTSFRAPALFELYLSDQTSSVDQRDVDPCINWAFNLDEGTITQELADNCANPAGPGGGVPGGHTGTGTSAELIESGGLGRLAPETSKAISVGFVWTPAFADLNVAVDYFEIEIEDEVTTLGGNEVLACYLSPSFPNDPVCDLFDRNPGTNRIDVIRSGFINIAKQENRGIDLTARYSRELPWGLGDMTLDSQFTWQLEDTVALFADNEVDDNGEIGDPSFVGNINLQVERGDWTAFWSVDMIGKQTEYADLGTDLVTLQGLTSRVKAHAEFTAFHSISLKHEFNDWSILLGLANVFDEHPPAVTTAQGGLGEYDYVGTSVLTSQYTEAYFGRRGFIRISKEF